MTSLAPTADPFDYLLQEKPLGWQDALPETATHFLPYYVFSRSAGVSRSALGDAWHRYEELRLRFGAANAKQLDWRYPILDPNEDQQAETKAETGKQHKQFAKSIRNSWLTMKVEPYDCAYPVEDYFGLCAALGITNPYDVDPRAWVAMTPFNKREQAHRELRPPDALYDPLADPLAVYLRFAIARRSNRAREYRLKVTRVQSAWARSREHYAARDLAELTREIVENGGRVPDVRSARNYPELLGELVELVCEACPGLGPAELVFCAERAARIAGARRDSWTHGLRLYPSPERLTAAVRDAIGEVHVLDYQDGQGQDFDAHETAVYARLHELRLEEDLLTEELA